MKLLKNIFFKSLQFLMPGKVNKRIVNYRLKLRQQKLKLEISKKAQIKVVFIVLHHSVWKYDSIYNKLLADSKFEPILVICPVVTYGEEYMESNLSQTFKYFARDYNVVNALKENGEWLDINIEIKPDVVFFTNPHKITSYLYQIDHFYNTLTCYVPYAFVVIHLLEGHYNNEFHSKLWRYFVETEKHKEFAEANYSDRNVIVSGYPGLDVIFNENYSPKDSWKQNPSKTFKIVWAPHHSIEEDKSKLAMSNFLEYADFFQEYVTQNENIQIAFKPHPLLKSKLYLHEYWGKERTDNYYEKWSSCKNGQLETGDYIDLFSQSDALILDSASFMVEYLYFGKPILFMQRDLLVKERLNEFGQLVLKQLCNSNNKSELTAFIDDVKNGKDTNKKKREDFFNKEIKTHKITSSEYIYNVLKNELS